MSMKISSAECIPLNIPFCNPRVMRAMQRALTSEERVYVYRIQLDDGTVGYGDETVPHRVEHLVGQNPFALMHDDRSGFGPQIAILDAVGRATGVPVHALLGVRLRSHCPISWWAIDMPATDWVAEAEKSLRRGDTSFKMKARPWFDILEQIAAVGKVVPADYKFDIDFNGFLRNPANAEVLLRELDEHANVGIYESPFHLFRDINGARLLRERVCKPIVEHFRDEYLEAHCADGFVVYGGGPTSIRRAATLSAAFDKPFWLQLVGAGITTAFAIHMGAVLSHAQLPCITISEVWEHDLLAQRLKVENGYIAVSDEPGLGIEVDEGAIERYRVAPEYPTPTALYRRNKRILRISWPGSGREKRVWDFTDEAVYQPIFYAGNIPGFERGVSLEVIEDDGSAGFGSAHAKLVEMDR